MYLVQKPPRSVFIPIRGLNYHLLTWGEPKKDQPSLFLMHGWMDVAASFQFMIDAFAQNRHIIAPDWRGYGLTEAGGPTDNFWFPDYLADLDALIDYFQPQGQIDLVGHSMGGNVVMMYAGIRPQRIRRLINLEGFGMAATLPAMAPGRFGQWLDQLKQQRSGELDLKTYSNLESVAQRLMKTNPRLPSDKAHWLAGHWSRPNSKGEWEILGHSAHKVINAQLYRVEEVQAIFKCISAPTLCVTASDNSMDLWWKGRYKLEEFMQRMQIVPNLRHARIEDAGHMLHHDQPQTLAKLVENFLDASDA
jgi:pimeloyl-ACP methyl ester carboxylesterase